MKNGKLSVYEGLVEEIKRNIALGIIAEGEKLPSCRETALKLGINPNTVQRAYAELEEQGIIFTVPKKGAYCGAIPLARLTEDGRLKEEILALKAGGLTAEQVAALVMKIYKEDGNDPS